jgi:hypothetical protein
LQIKYLSILQSRDWVVLIEFAFLFDGLIAPLFAIFAQEPVAAHHKPLDEPVFVDGIEHIIGRRGAEMAAGAVDGREHILVEMDKRFGKRGSEGAGRRLFLYGSGDREVGIFSPGCKIARSRKEK